MERVALSATFQGIPKQIRLPNPPSKMESAIKSSEIFCDVQQGST